MLAAALIAGRLSTRIGRVASAAARVAEGQLDGAPVGDRSGDELGVLSRGFDTMVGQLRTLVHEMATRAEQEQERLEGLVAARTAALDARNQDLRRVLDTVEQGLVLVDRDGKMSAERSAIMARWLGPAPDSLWAYLAQGDARTEAWLESAWGCRTEYEVDLATGRLWLKITMPANPTALVVRCDIEGVTVPGTDPRP
jgi:hypothetical protein